jgi:hypothetical protein
MCITLWCFCWTATGHVQTEIDAWHDNTNMPHRVAVELLTKEAFTSLQVSTLL